MARVQPSFVGRKFRSGLGNAFTFVPVMRDVSEHGTLKEVEDRYYSVYEDGRAFPVGNEQAVRNVLRRLEQQNG